MHICILCCFQVEKGKEREVGRGEAGEVGAVGEVGEVGEVRVAGPGEIGEAGTEANKMEDGDGQQRDETRDEKWRSEGERVKQMSREAWGAKPRLAKPR